MEMMMGSNGDATISPFFSTTGYLEDALIEFSIRFKRRRLVPLSLPCSSSTAAAAAAASDYDDDDHGIPFVDHHLRFPNEPSAAAAAAAFMDDDDDLVKVTEQETGATASAALSLQPTVDSSLSSPSMLNSVRSNHSFSRGNSSFEGEGDEVGKRVRTATRVVVYPFGLVKPGGADGDITLKDINQRILMPPTRPVRHPVGEYACRPCVSPDGPGLSGKAVVALTRIHTQGRGTITIIRTRG